MCWNKDVSLNTFMFSAGMLLLILYNNTYTQYKIKQFNNMWVYIFFCSFIIIQLLEFFVWSNLDNVVYNNFFSTLISIVILFQPIASLMMISNTNLRNNMIAAYCIIMALFISFSIPTYALSKVSKCGHLRWSLLKMGNRIYDTIATLIWLFFFLFASLYRGRYGDLCTAFTLFCIAVYNYYYDNSFGSMWCWYANSVMIYYAIYLLMYLPFIE